MMLMVSFSDLENRWGMRIESALAIRRVKVRWSYITGTVASHDDRHPDERRIQRGCLAWVRASHVCSDPDADGQRKHAYQGRKAMVESERFRVILKSADLSNATRYHRITTRSAWRDLSRY